MKKKLLILLMGLVPALTAMAGVVNNPKADPKAVVVKDDVRFTILTPEVIRMEWDSTRVFNDQSSFLSINRNLPVPQYTVKTNGKWLVITTSALELKYRLNSGKFNKENVSVKYKKGKKTATWRWGDAQSSNLKGTYRTLDTYDGAYTYKSKQLIPIEDGILAKDGWSFLDDSKNLVFDNSEWPWVEKRKNGNAQDGYFMLYGTDYAKAIKNFTMFAGKVPIPPKYSFGFWWSRYWNYSDNDLRELSANFRKYDIPMDVMVIDMDWHETDSLSSPHLDETGSRKHWTGWTWEKNYFPHPTKFLQWTDKEKYKTTLNLHPASGVAPYEAPYKEFAKVMNFDATTGKTIPYEGSNKQFMTALFDVILDPMTKQGVDFWWLDWQQWGFDKKITSLNNTWWLNYVFFSRQEQKSETRPMIYHRWGGLGNHRYQIGFSGDAVISWNSLAFLPYFTSTASNVLYNYWSHDIGGHYLYVDKIDPDLYVRWVQYGVFSPMLRIHSNKNARLKKEFWNFDNRHFNALRDAVKLRYELVPYIYTMARKTYEEGIGLCRPMYHDYPTVEEAYRDSSQYMYGEKMLVSAVTAPAKNDTTTVKVWLPEGNDWYEWHTGTMLKGGQTLERNFTLEEYPVYVKAGAVVPMYGKEVKNLQQEINAYTIAVFPGASGEGSIYEDAGNDKNYVENYATTKITSTLNGREQTIVIEPTKGSYPGMMPTRKYKVKLVGAEMPKSITVNGTQVSYNNLAEEGEWRYNGDELAVEIPMKETSATSTTTIVVKYSNEVVDVNTGMVHQMRDFYKKYADFKASLKRKKPNWVNDEVGRVEETNRILEYYPENFIENVNYFKEHVNSALDQIK